VVTRKLRKEKEVVDLRARPTQDWIDLVFQAEHKRPVAFEHYRFPTDRHAADTLAAADSWSEIEAKRLLRGFLIPSGSLGHDSRLLEEYSAMSNEQLGYQLDNVEFVRRLFHLDGPWEGVTWVLDLLPSRPAMAIQVIQAYYAAHSQQLPDGRADGLFDAMSVIRSRYFHAANARDSLASLSPAEFEFLVAALYKRLGYEVRLTRASRDGGIDIFATNTSSGSRATIFIQCKNYSKNVRVQPLRELAGLVLTHHANKGVLVSSSDFTSTTKREAAATPTIELLGFSQLNLLLNQHLGADWPQTMSYEIRGMQYEYDKQLRTAQSDVRPTLGRAKAR
jgi:restriction system protein